MQQFSYFANRWRRQLLVAALAVAALVLTLVLAPGDAAPTAASGPALKTTEPIPPRIVPYSPTGAPTSPSTSQLPSQSALKHRSPPQESLYKKVRWTFDSGPS